MGRPPKIALALMVAALAVAGCGGSDDGDGSDGGSSGGANQRLFSSSGFGEALDAARGSAGDDAQVISVDVTDNGAEFSVVADGEARGLIYTNGELSELEVAVVGTGPQAEAGFALSDIDAGAVDAMVAGVAQASGAPGLEIVGMGLEADPAGVPRWTITATAGAGETLTYRAAADGSKLVAADDATRGQPEPNPGQIPEEPVAPQGQPGTKAPSIADAEAALECVQAAEGDVEQLQECAELLQP